MAQEYIVIKEKTEQSGLIAPEEHPSQSEVLADNLRLKAYDQEALKPLNLPV